MIIILIRSPSSFPRDSIKANASRHVSTVTHRISSNFESNNNDDAIALDPTPSATIALATAILICRLDEKSDLTSSAAVLTKSDGDVLFIREGNSLEITCSEAEFAQLVSFLGDDFRE